MEDIKQRKIQLLQDSLKRLDQIENYIKNISDRELPAQKDDSATSSSAQFNQQITSLSKYKEFADAIGSITQKTKDDILKEISSSEAQSNENYQQENGIEDSIKKLWINPFEKIKSKTNQFRKSQNNTKDLDDLHHIISTIDTMNDTVADLLKTASNLEESAKVFERVEIQPTFCQKSLQNLRLCLCFLNCCKQQYRTDYESI